MKNYIQPGYYRTVTVSADIESGMPLDLGDVVGIACGTYANGEVGEFLIGGVHEFNNEDLAAVQGTQYAWDDTNKKIVATTMGDFELGAAVEASATGDGAKILINGLPYDFNGLN